jgi:hypothetical protein
MFTATAVVTLALWLLMATAEICTPLHAWLHGGAIPENDDCAVVAMTHGKVDSVICAAPVVVPVVWIEVTPVHQTSVIRPSLVVLPDCRGPPVSLLAS